MFDIKKLKNITLNDRNILEPFLTGLNDFSCEMSFANLAMWHEAYHTQYAFAENGSLILYSPVEKMIYFPRGPEISPEQLACINTAFTNANLTDGTIYDLPEDYLKKHDDMEKYFTVKQNEDSFDYIYDNQQLRDCTGNKLRKKRNLIKQFLQNNPDFQLIPLQKSTAGRFEILSMRLNSKLEDCDFIRDENKVISFACKNFRELSLHGVILNCKSSGDTGFAIWSELNQNIADIHFEKADHTVKGAPQFLTQQLASILCDAQIKYMNREQDLGSPGIRQAKHSLDPVFMYRRAAASCKK